MITAIIISTIAGATIGYTIAAVLMIGRRSEPKTPLEPQARIQFAGGGWILNFLSAFNQYVFRTYEEAEQALKERE